MNSNDSANTHISDSDNDRNDNTSLIRPPLTVILPLLGIYIILMLIPYILPNLMINQYLNIKYIVLPVIGLAIGYGLSILISKYMNIDVRSLLGLGRLKGRLRGQKP